MEDRLRQALDERRHPYTLCLTEEPGHAEDLARLARSQAVERIMVVGGDGTLHEAVNGLLEPEASAPIPPVVLLPVGTGNDFHRMLDYHGSVSGAMDLLENGRTVEFDVGCARWDGRSRYFVNLFGVGVDVEVLRRRTTYKRLPGGLQYLAALTSALLAFRPIPLRVELMGHEDEEVEVIEGPGLLGAVTVGPSVGGGILLCPGATPRDDRLDLCFVRSMGPWAIARNLPKVLRGRHAGASEIQLRRARKMRIQASDDRSLDFEMDGELGPFRAQAIELESRPRCLPVVLNGTDGAKGEPEVP